MSPYVRKTAAHALTKLYKYVLVHFLFFLVNPNTDPAPNAHPPTPALHSRRRSRSSRLSRSSSTTASRFGQFFAPNLYPHPLNLSPPSSPQLVIGSVIMAFEEICPKRYDLIHKHYRKLCNVLVDMDEWGQVAILRLLTRYARTQFLDPNQGVSFWSCTCSCRGGSYINRHLPPHPIPSLVFHPV